MLRLQSIVAGIIQKRALVGEFSWIVTGSVVSVLGALVGVRMLTHVLPPGVYGELALAMTAATLLNQVIWAPLSNSSTRFFSAANEAGELKTYLYQVATVTLIGCAIGVTVGIAAIVGAGWIGYGEWIPLLAAALVFALLSGGNSIMDGIQNAARQRAVVAWHQGLAPWLRFSCALLIVTLTGAVSSAAMWGYCLGSVIALASQAWFFFFKIVKTIANGVSPPVSSADSWRGRMWAYAWPFCTWGVLTWLQQSSDRWALQVFSSTTDVGLYAVVFQLGYYPLMLISGVVGQFIAPIFFQLAGDGTDEARGDLVTRRNRLLSISSLGLSACLVIAFSFFHSWIFGLLAAPEYQSVSWLLPLVGLSGGLFGTGQLISLGLMSKYPSQVLLKPKVFTALIGIGLNFSFARLWGLEGVVAAGIFTNAVYFLWINHLDSVRLANHQERILRRDGKALVP